MSTAKRVLTIVFLIAMAIAPAASARVDVNLNGWERTASIASRLERMDSASRSQERSRIYTVKRGDTLSKIDRKVKSPGPWTRLAYVNRKHFDDPNLIEVGLKLRVPVQDGKRLKWTPSLPSLPSSSFSVASASSSYSSGRCGGDLPTCAIMMCESGGNIRAENPNSSASGKWQFIDSTWGGYGGYARAKDAPESVQDERARQVWAGGAGRGNWEC